MAVPNFPAAALQDCLIISEAHLCLSGTRFCRLSACTASLGNYEHAGLQDWSYHDDFLAGGKGRNYF